MGPPYHNYGVEISSFNLFIMLYTCILKRAYFEFSARYSLWLLECSHDSSRCHITMFFNNSLAFPVILEEFDKQDGLRKVCNVVSNPLK
jgi:hypothetical protein